MGASPAPSAASELLHSVMQTRLSSEGLTARGPMVDKQAGEHVPEKLAHLPKLGPMHSGIPEEDKATQGQSVFNMVNAIMGAGVLGFPFCFKSCGMGLAALLILVNVLASEMSMRLLVLSSHLTNRRTYEELAYVAYGNWGQRLVDVCVVVVNMGSLVAYVNILADVWSAVAGTIIPPGAEPSRNVMMTVITLLGALPIALFVRSPQVLSFISQATVGYIFVFGCIICGMAVSSVGDWGQLAWWRWEGIGVSFSVIAYGFTAHQVLFAIYRSLKAPTVKRMNGVIARSMSLCALLYCMVGAAGYMLFKQRWCFLAYDTWQRYPLAICFLVCYPFEKCSPISAATRLYFSGSERHQAFSIRTSGDLLRNLGGAAATGAWGTYQRALKLGYGLSILGTIPLMIIPFYTTARPIVALASDGQPARSLTPAEQQHVTVFVMVVALLIAIVVPNVELIFALTGATASMLMAYVIPAAIYLRILDVRSTMNNAQDQPYTGTVFGFPAFKFGRRGVVALLLFGLTMAVVCTRSTLMAVHRENQVVQLATQLAVKEAKVIKTKELEQRAKQVAAAVDLVNEATKQLDTVQRQASDTLGAVKQAAQRIQQHDQWKPADKKQGNANLDNVQVHVTNTIVTLQNVTSVLTDTAERLRNSTSKAGKTLDRRKEEEGAKEATQKDTATDSHAAAAPTAPTEDGEGHMPQEKQGGKLPQKQTASDAEQHVAQVVVPESTAAEQRQQETAGEADGQSAESVPAMLDKVLESAIETTKKLPIHDAATAERALEVAKELGEQLAQRKETTPEVVIDHEIESTVDTLNQVAALANKSLTTVKETAAALDAVRQLDGNTTAQGVPNAKHSAAQQGIQPGDAAVDGSRNQDSKSAAEDAMQQLVNATQSIQAELDDSLQQLKTVQANREAELVAAKTDAPVKATKSASEKLTGMVLNARKVGEPEVKQPITEVQTTI